ncbi:MAG TPA: CPBP family intramembrane metalloprotease [Firmicutes bacterium]|nr:CPBP family intramembrane metalloprotease [Bacillota bacterium]
MAWSPQKNPLRYVLYTYALFALMLLTLGGIATVLFHGTPLVMRWLTAITAWTPTYVLLFMFRKLYPDSTIKSFIQRAVGEKLNLRLLSATTVLQMLVFIACVSIVSVQKDAPTMDFLNLSLATTMSALFFTSIQGATGEEAGWRGYLLPEVAERIGVVKGSLVVSVIWALWHAPIWFLGTGYSGLALVRYIIVFVVCITSLGFVMGICYFHCRNLLVPVWMHFLFNFMGELYTGSMVDLVTWYAAFYLVMAVGFHIWHRRNLKRGNTVGNAKIWRDA